MFGCVEGGNLFLRLQNCFVLVRHLSFVLQNASLLPRVAFSWSIALFGKSDFFGEEMRITRAYDATEGSAIY